MRFSISRSELLKPLQRVIGAVERRQTMAILGNVLLQIDGNRMQLTATDLEIELVSHCYLIDGDNGSATVPARKLYEICKALPDDSEISLEFEDGRAVLRSGGSRFSLVTLPASEYPNLDEFVPQAQFSLSQAQLKGLLVHSSFAMAQQDVRYYLNGLLLEANASQVTAVATDGHRLALAKLDNGVGTGEHAVIVPRKAIMELVRTLDERDAVVSINLGTQTIRFEFDDVRFTSKLIDGRFPDYKRVIPTGGEKILTVSKDVLRQALQRVSILSNEKYRGVRIGLDKQLLRVEAHNPEQEEAQVDLQVDYDGEPLDIGFNLTYLLDVISTAAGESLQLCFKDSNSSVLITDPSEPSALYVVMPMRL
ncbi:DNA polymerase III subunit beta [Acidihalobacter yilgarnensis]|uniref:Beta sliding clamp n=1 Tax=Acidihalobacter yilgarnensis TaxID=2819280 RepID=A0A1D8IJG9_9GAMM|nr:DNA polymerase III subunit beta [Acidihalobacter yilgarnensis]AOU96620.1 DNA polymerase III subunit beta [Acidihalobacter yilgarnensis]